MNEKRLPDLSVEIPIEQAAAEYNIPLGTLRRWRAFNVLEKLKINGRAYVRRGAIEEVLPNYRPRSWRRKDRPKSVGRIINGKKYDTATAQMLAKFSSRSNPTDFRYYEESLYMKNNGEYFLVGIGNKESLYSDETQEYGRGTVIRPFTLDEAKDWAEKRLGVETYEKLFGKVSE